MKIILIIVLSILFCPSLETQDEWPDEINCNIGGSTWPSNYQFDISQLPDGCDVFTVGQYALDLNRSIDSHFTESDKGIINTLLKANKVIYTKIGFFSISDWPSIFVPKNEENYKKTIMDPLVNFINSFNIRGIIIYLRWIHENIWVTPKDYTSFVNRLKQEVKHKIKVGLVVHGAYYYDFSNTTSFDFTITNEALDMYYIIFANLNFCNSDTKKYGMAPLTYPNPNVTSMEQVYSAITNSKMDKSKIYAWLQCYIRIPDDQPLVLNKGITTYSTYCSINTTNSSLWCQNPSQLSYDQAAYSKKNYKGIYIEILDADDFNSSCGCGQFPVTKAYISGWKSTKLTPCSRLGETEKTTK